MCDRAGTGAEVRRRAYAYVHARARAHMYARITRERRIRVISIPQSLVTTVNTTLQYYNYILIVVLYSVVLTVVTSDCVHT